MVLTTDSIKEENPEQFYDSLADEYDEMTGLEDRFKKERPYYQKLVDQFGLKTALDAGCGTGFHSILLAQLGVQLTATDISEQMLLQTEKNAEGKSVQVNTIRTSFQKLGESVHQTYDAIFCLGNSLPHLLSERELIDALKGFQKVLHPGGRLFLQMLNYDRILQERERIQNIKEVDGKIFIRFYDYTNETILFNILSIKKTKDVFKHSIHTVRLYPWRSSEVVRILKNTGFINTKLFGSIALDAFQEGLSKDLVVLAQEFTREQI
jgi:glycine/sarcosine N-methyltransferase